MIANLILVIGINKYINTIILIMIILIKKLHNADYFALTEKIKTNLKAPKLKVNESELLSKRTILVKFTMKTASHC